MLLAKWLIRMKPIYCCVFTFFFTVLSSTATFSIEKEGPHSAKALSEAPLPPQKEKSRPDPEGERIRALKSEYPEKDLRKLHANGKEFTALWRQDHSGKAFGAILIVPTDGQTANWPNTIDVIRTELPKSGWSTLAIDIEPIASTKAPPRVSGISPEPSATEQKDMHASAKTDMTASAESKNDAVQAPTNADSSNKNRIEAAIQFLNNQGQYNIIMVGYGQSAKRVLDYANDAKSSGMKKTMRSNAGNKMQRPIRAMILINPQQIDSGPIGPLIDSFNYKEMPILDLIIGKHYLDTLDANARKQVARSAGYEHYFQVKLLEPSSVVFGKENRLSRRIRGFLNKHAKGVEIDKR